MENRSPSTHATEPSPVSPTRLAELVRAYIPAAVAEANIVAALCADRVGPDSVGAKQYVVPGQPQKFETMDFDGLCDYYEEELRDLVNYAVMTHIRLGRLRAEVANRMRALEQREADASELLGYTRLLVDPPQTR
jgi:hypothetical protein